MSVLFYELNEVPWKVIDSYVKKYPKSHLAHLLKKSQQLTTHTQDTGDLHPWTTWPTLHRGVYNTTHNISFINQELPTEWKPIWEILSSHNVRCGIFGSLQSFPIPATGKYDFYIPDTFSPKEQTLPKSLESFQRFNLRQVKQDGALASEVSLTTSVLSDFLGMIKSGLSISTVFKLALHVMREKINKDHKTYRSILQAIVAFDFYKKLLNDKKPQFSTFFTNHVAGMMHRYWKHYFPEDFNLSNLSSREIFLSQNIEKAMNIADQQIGYLMRFSRTNNYKLFVLSSMGQEAINRGVYIGEYRIDNFDRFYQAIGYNKSVKNLMAMQPDFAFSFEKNEDLSLFKEKVLALVDAENIPIFTIKETEKTINLNLEPSNSVLEKNKIYFKDNVLSSEKLGFIKIYRDPGTGYHQPKGICLIYGQGITPDFSRREIQSAQILPTILSMFGIDRKEYMQSPIDL